MYASMKKLKVRLIDITLLCTSVLFSIEFIAGHTNNSFKDSYIIGALYFIFYLNYDQLFSVWRIIKSGIISVSLTPK